ncbi:MAG: hypothetical protein OHK0029_14140 [Armatimonadaceae bacterium]
MSQASELVTTETADVFPKSRYLMCAPDYFGVEYVINPWMQGNQGRTTHNAQAQWHALHDLLSETLHVGVEVLPGQPGLPDMVFTANAGLVRGNQVVPTRFRFAERQREEPFFHEWFRLSGYKMQELPEKIAFEGEGDALFDRTVPDLLWAADGYRSDAESHSYLAQIFGVEVIPLKLADPRFYHLDTCFAPLPGGRYLWFPSAFDADSQRRITERIPEADRHALSEEDAIAFAANAIPVRDDALVLNAASDALRRWLQDRGITPHMTPLTEFMKAGGSAKCLVLTLP